MVFRPHLPGRLRLTPSGGRFAPSAPTHRDAPLALLALVLLAQPLRAQGPTGKLEGRVSDVAGAPLAGAQVYLIGTAFGAVTDPRGHYFINNIPAGAVAIRAAYIGYRPVEIRDLRLLADQTTTQDFTLAAAPLRLRELVVVAADNPLVPRDEVTSKQRVSGEFARDLPVDRLQSLLALQPGVVADPDAIELSIRGGRPDEAATYVDGVPVSPGYRGFAFSSPGTALKVGTNAVEEGSVITGSSSAEYGNAQSGIISIATRTGGSSYAGALGYESDEPFGSAHSLGFNRIEASLGGPIARRLTFFAAGVLEGQRSASLGPGAEDAPVFVSAGVDTTVAVPAELGVPTSDTTYVNVYRYAVSRGRCEAFGASANEGIRTNYGLSCRGIRTPGTASSNYELQGKLNYTYGSGSRVTLSYLGSQTQDRFFDYRSLYDPANTFGRRAWSRAATLSWVPNLSRSAGHALALETYLSYQQDRAIEAPLSLATERGTRDPFGGFIVSPLGFLFGFDNFPLDQELLDNVRTNRAGSRRTPYDLEHPDQYRPVDRYRDDAYALPGWLESGGPDGDLRLYRENRYLAKANLDWQADRYNRIKVGAEFVRHAVDRYQANLIGGGADVYLEHPRRGNLFVEDRLDLGDVVLVGGLRYDAYQTRAGRPFLLDTIAASPTFGQYVAGFDRRYVGQLDDGRPLSITRPDRRHGYLSPHIQVSFPVTARTNFRLSYAHQVEVPDFAVLLFEVNFAGVGADLDFGRTIAYEFGIRHAFSDDMVLDLSAYNRDNLANAALRTLEFFDPVWGRSGFRQRFTNADFGNTRGVDVRLDRRIGNVFNGTLAYTYQSARSTASDPFSNRTRALTNLTQVSGFTGPPPQAILPTTFSRPHTLAAAVSLTLPPARLLGGAAGRLLGSLGLFATFRYTSGTAYTRCSDTPGNEGVLSGEGCAQGTGAVNGTRLPALRQLDLRLTKGFSVGRLGFTAYLDARNVVNFRNVLQVYSANGGVTSDRERDRVWAADSALYAAEAAGSGVLVADGGMDLRFGGLVASGCGDWVTAGGQAAAPNCVYLIRAEERFGDGDHVFDLGEQRRASEAAYLVDRGRYLLTGPPRRLRLGLEVSF